MKYTQLIFDKVANRIQRRKDCLYNKWCWSNSGSISKKLIISKLNFIMCIKTQNEPRTYGKFGNYDIFRKINVENMFKSRTSQVLNLHTNSTFHKNINQTSIKIKPYLHKRPYAWEDKLQNYEENICEPNNKKRVSTKNFYKLTSKTTIDLIRKWTKDLNKHFSKVEIHGKYTREKNVPYH